MYHGLDRQFTEQEFVSIDTRHGDFQYAHRRFPKTTVVSPDILADMRLLPFRSGIFATVMFDPPHSNFGNTSYMCLRYGSMSDADFAVTLQFVNEEFWRVLISGGCLITKVIDKRVEVTRQLLTRFKLLLDIKHRSLSQRSKNVTHWLIFVRSELLARVEIPHRKAT
jgi:hypothetical protein